VSQWLVDKSALVRLSQSNEADEWASRIERGLVRISSLTRLEVGFSARSAEELRASKVGAPLAWMVTEYLTPAIEDRAIEVQQTLADRGLHRAPSIPDLLIAATAELKALTVLHVDKDFELIATVTGQAIERLEF
jgi:predicted nucleic acid-binding protein